MTGLRPLCWRRCFGVGLCPMEIGGVLITLHMFQFSHRHIEENCCESVPAAWLCLRLASTARLLYWSSPTRPRPNLLSGPAPAQLSPFWTPLSSTQAPAADTITTRAAVHRTAQLLSGAASWSIPSPETLRYQKLTSTPSLLGCKSPLPFIGFILSECVSECVGACPLDKPV